MMSDSLSKWLAHIILVACALSAVPGWGAVLTVRQDGSGDFDTINGAIFSVTVGDTIRIGPGVYHEMLSLTKPVTLLSEQGPEFTILDGDDCTRIIAIENGCECFITGLTFRHAFRQGEKVGGSALSAIKGSIVHLNECVFTENQSGWDGAAIVACDPGTQVEAVNCRFVHNYAYHNAGACGVILGATLRLVNCDFIENSSNLICGAVAAWYANLEIENCLFVRNSAVAAGALRIGHSQARVSHNTFHENSSPHHGTILIDDSPSTVFTHNVVTSDLSGFGLKYDGETGEHDCNIFFDNLAGPIYGSPLAANEKVVDPRYCDFTREVFGLGLDSPALATASACGRIGAFAKGCTTGGPTPAENPPAIVRTNAGAQTGEQR